VIGLAPPDLPSLVMREHVRDIDVLEAATVVRHTMHELERNFNIQFFIILSHMGFERDSVLAAEVDGIDVIVGGHSHTVLQRPEQVTDALIVQAGSRGQWLGVLRLHVDPVTGVIQNHDGQLLATRVDEVEAHPVVAGKVAELEAMVAEGLGEVIATLESDWKREPRGESNIGNWQADVMRDFAGTDIAFQNSGGIRKDLDAGPITLRDMWEISPFGNEFVIFEVSGTRLLEMLRYHATQSREFCQVSGLRYSYDATLPPEKALHVEINGQPVNRQRSYSIVTNSYIGGHLHDVFGLPEKDITLRKSMPVMVDRDVFIDHARRQGRILSRVEGRIHIIGERP
jgi:5'-nucleotidase / UDP-sugar diphosphatase